MKFSVFYFSVSILLLSYLFTSCQPRHADKSESNLESEESFRRALQVAESNPLEAYLILSSINTPQKMDEQLYMEYIVRMVQAKYRNYYDVTQDTLIFRAQRYFEQEKGLPLKAALAHFYAGAVYREQGMPHLALECYLKAKTQLEKTEDKLYHGKVAYNIGDLYFEQILLEHAIEYYKEAADCYEYCNGIDVDKISIFNKLGRCYLNNYGSDSAYYYFNKALEIPETPQTEPLHAIVKSNLGVLFCETGEYAKAKAYSHAAIAQTKNSGDSLSVFLNLLDIYTRENKKDSAQYYNALIEKRMNQISDDYVLLSTYNIISHYYLRMGDYQKSVQFLDSQNSVNQNIILKMSNNELKKMENDYHVQLEQVELKSLRWRIYLLSAIAILVALFVVLGGYFYHKGIYLKAELLDQKVGGLLFLLAMYQNVVKEWGSINREIKALAREYGATEKPAIFVRMENLVKSFKKNTNEQLIEWAKDYVKKTPFGKKVLNKLENDELIFLVLCCSGYDKTEIAAFLGIPEPRIYPQKLNLKHILKEAGLSNTEIKNILSIED